LILFDGKCDALPQLAALGLNPEDESQNIYILDPNDERCAVWDLAEATRTPLMARYLATLLVPEEQRSSAPFFPDSARDLIFAVLLGLGVPGNPKWDFRDLICALDSRERIRAITARHPRAKVIAERILSDEKHSFGVLSSLGTKIVRFESVAALWNTAPSARKFTIEKFLAAPGVLVLGNDPVLRDSIWPINALLLKALTQEILRRPNTRRPRHWFVLDEFPAMERVDCIHDLLRRGRSKGASVLIGAQGIEALTAIYDDNGANDLLSQCTYKTFLRCGGPRTAAWAESFFGHIRRTEASYSESHSSQGSSHSCAYHVVERSLFIASTFMNLPLPDVGKPFIAVSDVPCLDATLISRRWSDQLFAWCRQLSADTDFVAAKPRNNVWEQTLEQWSDEEERSFLGQPQKGLPPKAIAADSSAAEGEPDAKPYLPGLDRRREADDLE
jgi:type IV secretory pathway TraG/TraD family ATPase VirD4